MIDEKKYVRTGRYYDHGYKVPYNRKKVKNFTGSKLGYGHKVKPLPKWWVYYNSPMWPIHEKKLERYLYRVALKFIGKPVDQFFKFLHTRLPHIPWDCTHFTLPWVDFYLENDIICLKKHTRHKKQYHVTSGMYNHNLNQQLPNVKLEGQLQYLGEFYVGKANGEVSKEKVWTLNKPESILTQYPYCSNKVIIEKRTKEFNRLWENVRVFGLDFICPTIIRKAP